MVPLFSLIFQPELHRPSISCYTYKYVYVDQKPCITFDLLYCASLHEKGLMFAILIFLHELTSEFASSKMYLAAGLLAYPGYIDR